MADNNSGEGKKERPIEDDPKAQVINPPPPPNDPYAVAAQSVPEQPEKSEIQNIKDRVRRSERWMILLTGAIVVVGILQWSAMRGQLGQMARQLPELQRSAKAAEDAARATQDSVDEAKGTAHLDQRAWVAVSDVRGTDFQVGQPFIITVVFKNTGKTPAKNMLIASAVDPVRKRSKPDFTDQVAESRGLLPPGGEANITLNATGKSESGVKQTGYDQVRSGQLLIYAHGRIDYADIFACRHWTTFCYMLMPDGKTFGICKQHNDADNNQCQKAN